MMIGVNDERWLHGGQDTTTLPFGQVPTHRHHGCPGFPAGEAGHEMLRGVAQAHGQDVAEADALFDEDVGDLRGPAVQLLPSHLPLGPILGREDHADAFRIRLGDPADLGAVGHARTRHDRCHPILPFSGPTRRRSRRHPHAFTTSVPRPTA